jgi:putative glutamine amidotransferase
MKPRIGITPCSRPDDYVESVKRAGGEPITLRNSDDPGAVVVRLEGLLLTGGLDVDPSFYGEDPHDTTTTSPDRDRFELPLAKAAMAADLPIFAICRGVQVLNVAAGGSLVQDIPSAVTSELNHLVDLPKMHHAHPVSITPGTRLAAALGPEADLETCLVNSRHHQSVARVAPQFVVAATSPDGVVEAIERPDRTFCLGVQWHPENFVKTGEFAGLFRDFVAAAATRPRRA